MKKYLLTFAVALMAAFAFTACSSSSNDDDPTPGPTPVPTAQPFTVTALESGVSVVINVYRGVIAVSDNNIKLVYSTDGQNWEDYTFGKTINLFRVGDKVFFKAGTKANPNIQNKALRVNVDNSTTHVARFESTGRYKISGNILSLLYGDKAQRTLKGDATKEFSGLFGLSTGLVDASELLMPTNVSEGTFSSTFADCPSLIAAPELPATKMAKSCYETMFRNCKALKIAPELPATALADKCYTGMFMMCNSLTKAPSRLPATKLAESCYGAMFSQCSSLKEAVKMDAKEMAKAACNGMYSSCTSLVTAPELPATTLGVDCYAAMFMNCKSLKTAPELPATKLAEDCYGFMFNGCSSLEKAPVLSASEANVKEAYSGMFGGCVKLNLVEMLATKVSSECIVDFLAEAGTSATNATLYVAKGMKSNPIIAAMENPTWTVKEK